jgi:hypothetical protein
MPARYIVGQKVKVVALIDSHGKPDPQIQRHVSEVGTVVKSYCIFKEEMIEKTMDIGDVYCCDIRLDEDGTILRGIPEVALEPYVFRRG